jgi:hypothetical protein
MRRKPFEFQEETIYGATIIKRLDPDCIKEGDGILAQVGGREYLFWETVPGLYRLDQQWELAEDDPTYRDTLHTQVALCLGWEWKWMQFVWDTKPKWYLIPPPEEDKHEEWRHTTGGSWDTEDKRHYKMFAMPHWEEDWWACGELIDDHIRAKGAYCWLHVSSDKVTAAIITPDDCAHTTGNRYGKGKTVQEAVAVAFVYWRRRQEEQSRLANS